MILQKLIEHSSSLDMPPANFDFVPVKYIINIDNKGIFQSLDLLDGGRRTNDRGKKLLSPTLVRSSGIKPKLLVDNSAYVLGVSENVNKKEKTKKAHEQFQQLLSECLKESANLMIEGILHFYENNDYGNLPFPDDYDKSMNLTFRVNGKFPIDDISVQEFWAKKNSIDESRAGKVKCHICGIKPALEMMPGKIKRIPGGQPAGMSLISANSKVFESFGLPRSKTSPTCSECAEKFTFTLNHLLADEDSHLTVGKQVYVFWSKGEAFSPAKVLQKPDDFFGDLTFEDHIDPEEVKIMFNSAFSGQNTALGNQDDKFYAAAFSAAGARVVLRDWIETTIPETKDKLAQFFADCFIKYQDHPNGVFSLASSTVFDARKDLPPNTFTKLLNTALKGARLPEDLLYRAINRAKAEKTPITHPRASIIKLYYLTNNKHKEIDMVQLDKMTKKPAYLCGRLMSVLEEIQSSALGTTNATIVDRYYGTASTAPATVFSTLLSGTRHHLGKLRKQKPGFYINLEKKLQEVVSELPEFPKVLSLEEQGLFALGYYHQKQERFQKTKKEEIE